MRAIVIILTIFLVLAFATMAASGGYLIYQEIGLQGSFSDIEVTVERDSLTLSLLRATPGLIIFCFGAIGLILMTYRIPTKEVLGYQNQGGGGSGMGLLIRTKILATEQTCIPLPVWWLIQRTGWFERINNNG